MNRSKYYLHLTYLCLSFLSFLELDTLALSAPTSLFKKRNQLFIVLSQDISSVRGTAFIYERNSDKAPWSRQKKPFPVSFGGKGLGYATSLLPYTFLTSSTKRLPEKKEGDLRSPIGIFELKTTFGRQQKKAFTQSLKFPYLELTPQSYCIDDVHSPDYNQYVSYPSSTDMSSLKKETDKPWLSAENLYSTEVYDLGVWVDYNHRRIPSKGSCIFLHRWSFPFETTAGCTALTASNLRMVVSWLNRDQSPLLVQMPLTLYNQIYRLFNFPKIHFLELKTQE